MLAAAGDSQQPGSEVLQDEEKGDVWGYTVRGGTGGRDGSKGRDNTDTDLVELD